MKKKEKAKIISQEKIASDVYSMWLTASFAGEVKPGQFISIYSNDGSRLLPRPISICQADGENGSLRVVYRTVGKGTLEFSKMKAGEMLDILGPLGNGFPLEEAAGKKLFLIGGGIGIPPMVQTAKEVNADVTVISGYRDELFLTDDLKEHAQLYIATEDGSCGTKGNVVDAIRENHLTADIMFACGPTPMLRALKNYAAEHNIICYLSMEEKMACGIGACLACVCQSTEVDGHSYVHNKRICKDGPVFLASEVEL